MTFEYYCSPEVIQVYLYQLGNYLQVYLSAKGYPGLVIPNKVLPIGVPVIFRLSGFVTHIKVQLQVLSVLQRLSSFSYSNLVSRFSLYLSFRGCPVLVTQIKASCHLAIIQVWLLKLRYNLKFYLSFRDYSVFITTIKVQVVPVIQRLSRFIYSK